MATITRRAVLGAGVGGAAALLLGPGPAIADDTMPTFVLDPTAGRDGCGSSCASCSACAHHGANKLFTTEAVAAATLAHPGCHCVVVPGPVLLRSVYDRVFMGGATVADRRWNFVASALAANGNQRSVPLFEGAAPLGVVLGGVAAAAWWTTRTQRSATRQPLS